MLTEALVKVALLGAEWVLYLLVFLSTVSVALIVERALVYRRSRQFLGALEKRLLGFSDREAARAKNVDASKEYKLLGSLAEAAATADEEDKSGQLLSSQVHGTVAAYRRHLERFTPVLGTLGNNAPFIGLLGTVIGVIVAFDQLQVEMEGGAASVMGGISEALVATATGIAVALPCVVAYNYFAKLAEAYSERFELLAWTRVKHAPKK
jgi:biopolymer transport protein ExbB/TolQ